jgi:hypothetical protein
MRNRSSATGPRKVPVVCGYGTSGPRQPYRFTDEELDFIINYDIKYRMGKDAGEEG